MFFFFADTYYYTNNDPTIVNTSNSVNTTAAPGSEQSSRSPLAATRANSLASANSPTESGSACQKGEEAVIFNSDLNHLWSKMEPSNVRES